MTVAFAIAVVELGEVDVPVEGWDVGPFPFHTGTVEADERARLTYFRARTARILFGGDGRAVRWHRSASFRACGLDAGPVELLVMPRLGGDRHGRGSALLVVHVDLGDRPVEHLIGLKAGLRDATVLAEVVRAAGLRAQVPERPQVTTVSYVALDGRLEPTMGEPYGAWPPVRQWLWALASATSVDDYPPDPDDPLLFDGEIPLSASWRALVLRQGTAFVGMRPAGTDPFLRRFAPVYVRTLYLDTLLLGLVQRSLVNELSDEVARAALWPPSAGTVTRLNRDLLEFRAAVWRQQITVAGHANQLLGAYQRQNLVAELLEASADSIADLAANLQEESNLRTSAALGLIALVGFPLSLALTGMQVLGATGWPALLVSFLAGGLGAAVMIGSRPGRELLGPLPPTRRSDRDQPAL